jgi:hypothetical protein
VSKIALLGVTAMTTKDAEQIADGLIRDYLDPDYKVTDLRGFLGALVQALEAAHQQGWNDCVEKGKLKG